MAAFDPQRRFATVKCRTAKGLFDHLIGDAEQQRGDGNAEPTRSFEVDDEIKFRRPFYRQIARTVALQ